MDGLPSSSTEAVALRWAYESPNILRPIAERAKGVARNALEKNLHTCRQVINNFRPQFNAIRARAGIADGRFHDLRSTALTNWFTMGLREYEVMRLAGHSKFETTHRFYLAVADDLVDRARNASDAALGQVLARTWRAPLIRSENEVGQQAQVLAGP